MIKFRLRRDISNWPDSTQFTGEFKHVAADTYTLDFLKLALDLVEKLREGKKYYVEYEVQRPGAISNDKFTKDIETSSVKYGKPAVAQAVGR